jgi:LacI family transcriptional regulator/LacI family repressor for deo operon, udp, cdd, tsx, nupC, and nupG
MARLKDVAKKAGVASATVSRVLNNSPKVSVETRQKVNKAIKELGYKRDRVARRLRAKDGKTHMMGLLIPDIRNPFYVDVIQGIEEYALDNEYAILMCNFGQDEVREKLYMDIMRAESIDGLIAAPIHQWDKKVTDLIKSGLPIVCLDRSLSGVKADVVVVDNRHGAFKAIELLLKSGHIRIGFIAGKPQIPTSVQRLRGYEDALREYGIEKNESLIKFGDSKYESGKELAKELLETAHPPTALFTGNNLITLGALETIHKRGLQIPDDIALVGFDDMYWSSSLNPPLTAVRQPGYEMGRRAAEMLLQRIDDPNREYATVELKTKLMIRQSCGSEN